MACILVVVLVIAIPCPAGVVGDLNGDGKADIVWRHAVTGQNAVWTMNGANILSAQWFTTISDPNWQIVTVADFNGDGKADILWRNAQNGQTALWLMSGASIVGSQYLTTVSDLNWQIVAVADFDGDKKADILWRNMQTGQNALWLMNGSSIVTAQYLNTVSDLNWQIVGVGDFNGDGKADILWRNPQTGQNALWTMNGTSLVSAQYVNGVSDVNWQVIGVGDFNGDGKADILWRNTQTGQNAVWLMNGATMMNGVFVMTVTDLNWQIVGIGDLNGDGKADVVWRNTRTGENVLWLMNGASVGSAQYLPTISDGNFKIVGGNARSGAPSLSGAFNFPGPYPTPASVTYKDKSGVTRSVLAYPGQVEIGVSPSQMSTSAVASFAAAHGGAIIAQIPSAGLYWIRVNVGSEGPFITAAFANGAVLFAVPNTPFSAADTYVDLSGATSMTPVLLGTGSVAQFDNFSGTDVCQESHGAAVSAILDQAGLVTSGIGTTQPGLNGMGTQNDLIIGFDRAAEGALLEGHPLVVNMSLQSGGEPNDTQDRSACETTPNLFQCLNGVNKYGKVPGVYSDWKKNEGAFLTLIAQQLQNMRPALLNNTLVVISSGNAGINLTSELDAIRNAYPAAFSHMLIVGASNSGQPLANYNFSQLPQGQLSDPNQVLYAQGVGVPIPGTACQANGTSFAAPQVAALAALLARDFPYLTMDQIRSAILSAAGKVGGRYMMPTYAQARAVAATLLPPTYKLSVGKTGTGSGGIASSDGKISCGGACSAYYTVGSTAVIAAAASAGSRFIGWSGACGGTDACVLRMVADMSATATFNLIPTYTVSVGTSGDGSGTVGISPPGPSYQEGTTVTITATAASGSVFAGWSGTCAGQGTSCTVTLYSNVSTAAIFNKVGGSIPVAGNYAGSCTAAISPSVITCCAAGQCISAPAPGPFSAPFSFSLQAGETLSQFTSQVCAQVNSATAAAGCAASNCSFTYSGNTSARFSASCTVPPVQGCTVETVSETCTANLQ